MDEINCFYCLKPIPSVQYTMHLAFERSKRNKDPYIECPYDKSHRIPELEVNYHSVMCPSKDQYLIAQAKTQSVENKLANMLVLNKLGSTTELNTIGDLLRKFGTVTPENDSGFSSSTTSHKDFEDVDSATHMTVNN